MLSKSLFMVLLTFATLTSNIHGQSIEGAKDADRAADRTAIRAHIESIFEAFIKKDREKVRATHSDDWRGFLEGSRTPIRGIEEYMQTVDWVLKTPNAGMSAYKITDYDTIFHGSDLAVVSFNADIEARGGGSSTLRILDVYAKRNGAWIQAASHTVVHPAAIGKQISTPSTVSPPMRESLLKAREAVWRAFFNHDRAALEKLIPEETIAINEGPGEWANRAAILASSKGFAESGGKLLRLEFPKTEIQVYGATAIIYTTYLYELEVQGKRSTTQGRGTEIFVRRNNEWVNSGWHLDTVK